MYTKLDALRGLAACLVVLHHSPFCYGEQPVSLVANSYLFVDFFFLLSGFVMCHAYGQRILSGMSMRDYVVLRLGRLYPLHLFMLLATVAYTGLKAALFAYGFGNEQDFSHNHGFSFITNVLLVHSLGLHEELTWNTPSWSISVEFYTYLVFYVLTISLTGKAPCWFP